MSNAPVVAALSIPPKSRRGADRISAIIDIAWETFLEKGYAATSIGEISDKAGGSRATLYSYFPSKEELFLAVVQHKGNAIYAQLGQAAGQWTDLREGLGQFGRRLLSVVLSESNLALQRLVIAEGGRFPLLTKASYEHRRDLVVGQLSVPLAQEMDAGRLVRGDPTEVAEMFWNMCSASAYRRALMVRDTAFSRQEIDHQVDFAVNVFLSAYGTSSADRHSVCSHGPAEAPDCRRSAP